MAYSDRFIPTDNLILHLKPYSVTITDMSILASYAGFLSVSAITVYGLCIKEIFCDFAKKNTVFGHFTEDYLSRINGRIQINDLKKNQIKAFGEKYLKKFDNSLDKRERE